MASWLKCIAKRDGAPVYVNLENAVSVYWSERDKGTIIAFVGGEKDAVTVQEKPEQIIQGPLNVSPLAPQLSLLCSGARTTKGLRRSGNGSSFFLLQT
jgi:hypothetical protein